MRYWVNRMSLWYGSSSGVMSSRWLCRVVALINLKKKKPLIIGDVDHLEGLFIKLGLYGGCG